MDYIDILNSIKKCEGGLVTVMLFDYDICNNSFLKSLYQELNKEYNVEYDNYNVENINVKTVVFINMSKIPITSNTVGRRNVFFRNIVGNKNVILIAIRHINLALTPSLYGGEESYIANIILSLKDKKLKILKSRYIELNSNESLDISNTSKLVRKIKLNRIIKNNL